MNAARIICTLALTSALGAAGSAPSWASGRPLAQQVDQVLGSCGVDDDLIGSFSVRESGGTSAHSEQLHLRVHGTVTRTGTGVVGRYAEVQMDVFGDDGSEKYVGALSRLTLPSGRGFALAGKAQVTADGDFSFTKGLTAMVEDDWVAKVCAALS
jgi:hypothetical protein